MFKSIAMAVLALSMTVEGTVPLGKDLYNAQKEAQQEIQQRKAEEALDDDTTYLEENPEAYMTEDDTQSYQSEPDYDETYEESIKRREQELMELNKIRVERELNARYPYDYRGNVWQHDIDAAKVLSSIYQSYDVTIMISYELCECGIITVPGLGKVNFTFKYNAYGPYAMEVSSEDGNDKREFKLDRELNIVSYTYMN